MRMVRIFVSSPGDVPDERERVQHIAEKLEGEFVQLLRLETILWETSVYNAHDGGFQPQIERRAKPGECDIVIAIFWSRLGTELPGDFPFRMPDGKPYPSGTAYEVLSALEARRANGHRPDVYVFRKTGLPPVPFDKGARAEVDSQWERLEGFFARWFEAVDRRILRVAEKYQNLREFDRKIEALLRDWIASNIPQGTVWPIETKGSPFRGLEPFDAKHAAVFCGRDRKVLRAIEELVTASKRGKPFLLIPGASGAGKSSLMRAGIAPRLTRPGTVSGVDVWRIAVMRPAGDALQALARALFVTADTNDDPGGFGTALPELADGSFKSPDQLAALFAAVLFAEKPDPNPAIRPIIAALDQVSAKESKRRKSENCQVNLLLLVDQLEDVFAAGTTPEQRGAFANLIAALVNSQRIWVVATLRGKIYEEVITERPFIALKDIGGQYDLTPPGPDELDEIVHKSAQLAGLEYEVAATDRLDDRLLRDAAGDNTLPLLQFALDLLFKKCCVDAGSKTLSIKAYEEIGGIDGAINQTAEKALAALVCSGRDIEYPLKEDIKGKIAQTFDPRLERLLRALTVSVGSEQPGAETAGDSALAGRILSMGEVSWDEPTRRLIDSLLRARVLVASQTKQGSWLRIAHDRVFKSWARAKELIAKNREFVHVRDYIEHQRRLWEENGRRREYLIPAGVPIVQAEEKVRQSQQDFSPATRAFVATSGRHARIRHRLTQAVAIVFGLVAAVAIWQWVDASYARQKAMDNYHAARDTVGDLVTGIARNLRNLDGINVDTIKQALSVATGLVGDLEMVSGEDNEMKRVSASMHYEFAKVFQKTDDLTSAEHEALEAGKIREILVSFQPNNSDWLWDRTLSLDQMGDIRRKKYEMAVGSAGGPSRTDELDAARKLFDQSLAIRRRLRHQDDGNPKWMIGVSQSLVRIGDVEVADKRTADQNLGKAKADYEAALESIIEVFRREPDKVDGQVEWQREISWDFNKNGDILLRTGEIPAALDMYEKSLCTRRFMLSGNRLNTLWKDDVAFSLERVAQARSRKGDADGALEALFEALHIRRELNNSDRNNNVWLRELAQALDRIGHHFGDLNDQRLAAGFADMAADLHRILAYRLHGSTAEGAPRRTQEQFALRKDAESKEEEYRFRFEQPGLDPASCWTELKAHLPGVERQAEAKR